MGAGTFQPQPEQPKPTTQKLVTLNLNAEVALPTIIDFVRNYMGIQIIYADDLSDKKVYFPAPIAVPESRLLNFLILVLEQKGYTLVQNKDLGGFFMIVPTGQGNIPVGVGQKDEAFASTQVVSTRGLKPSALNTYMNLIGNPSQVVFADDLGVIIVTDSPGKIDVLRQFIDRLVEVRDELQWTSFEVHNISAVTARERILTLVGEMTGTQGQLGAVPQPGVPTPNVPKGNQPPGGTATAGFPPVASNLTFQLLVDAQSNALLFRGRPEERAYVEQLLAIVDVANKMKSVFYEVGVRAAEVIAFQGSREGLGDVTTYQSTTEGDTSGLGSISQPPPRPGVQNPNLPGQQQGQGASNAAGFVIYPEAGGFMFHGTPEQHARIDQLARDLIKLSQGDLVTMEFYKLKHAKAEDVVGIIGSLLGESSGSANTGSILGGDLNRNNQQPRGRSARDDRNASSGDQIGRSRRESSTGGGLGSVGNDETTVIEDTKNNQVIVKTRQRLQQDFAKLIQRLDARRPQVYISAQIIAVTDTMNNRLAVETQIIAGQFGLNTDFGLGSFGDMGDFLSPKDVVTGLPGFTAALVRSDFVPFIITAIQSNTDSRILATPQLLVDDNEFAQVVSENEIPTAVTRFDDNGQDVQSVGDPVTAGTSLEVTPQISENAVKLDVFIEQSAFTGEPVGEGLPPPSQRNTVQSLVTVPRDCTIVIGGLVFESDTSSVVKVPLLGDIPIAGLLFRDTTKGRQRATLYVFITPRIMTDPTFGDVRLLTKGPAAAVQLDADHIMPPPTLVPTEIGRPMLPMPLQEPDDRPAAPSAPSVPPPIPIGSPNGNGNGNGTKPAPEKKIQP